MKKICACSSCKQYATDGSNYCENHRSEFRTNYFNAVDKLRGTATARGYTSKWQVYAKAFLIKNNICAVCGGASECVGHKLPANLFPELFWDKQNHYPLCRSCNAKQASEDKIKYA